MYILFITSVLSSCRNTDVVTDNKIIDIRIGTSDLREELALSQLIDDYRFISLETVDSSLIMEIRKVICFNNSIFILDKSTQKLLKFSEDGIFISQIGMQGEGPGEYLEMLDFTIDEKNHVIIIAGFRKVLLFTLEGDYIRSYRTEFSGPFINILPNGFVAFYGGSRDYRLIITDRNGNVKSKYFVYNDIHSILPNSYYFSNSESNSFIHIPGNDTIFSIIEGVPVPAYFLNFGSKQYSYDDFNKLKRKQQLDFRNNLLKNGDYFSSFGFLPSINYIYIQLLYSNRYYSGFYNRLTQEVIFIDHSRIVNDLFDSFFYINPVGVYKDEFITSIPAYKLIENSDNLFFSKDANKHILKNLNEYSNPVLFFYKPKIDNILN